MGLINALLIEEAKHASALLTDVSDWLYQVQQDIFATHLSSRAFNQLRTEEQLGYAAGGFAGNNAVEPRGVKSNYFMSDLDTLK